MLAALAQIRYFDHMGGYGLGWGGIVFMGLLAALFVALIVWIIVSLTSRRRVEAPSSSTHTSSKSAAKAILDERYARGEIDRDDYLQRKGDLEGQ
jgi:putative membrane protein